MQKICIIIPCYNEASRLDLDAYRRFLKTYQKLDLCFVNDGSQDDTLSLLEQLEASFSTVSVIHLEKNHGKAEAIRQAIFHLSTTNYNYLGYLDADLSTSLDDMMYIVSFISDNTKFIMGSRIKTLNTSIERSALRHMLGRALATIVNLFILKLPIYDTQCGAKLIETPLARDIFKQPFVSKWLFDIELLLRTNKLKGTTFCKQHILEVPLNKWHDKGNSRITFMDFINIPIDLLKIYFKYRK